MALRPCRECQQLISTDAVSCPRCGKKQPTSAPGGILRGVVAAIVLLGVVMFCTSARVGGVGGSSTSPATLSSASSSPAPAASPADRLRLIRTASSCAPPKRTASLIAAHPDWTNDAIGTVACKQIVVGMTQAQLVASWGRPEQVNSTVGRYSSHDQYVYGSEYVYVEDGVVTSYQLSR